MNICITEEQLKIALKELKLARKNGFNYSLAVFDSDELDGRYWLKLGFEDLLMKAHPTDGRYNWGRSSLYKYMKFINGSLITIQEAK